MSAEERPGDAGLESSYVPTPGRTTVLRALACTATLATMLCGPGVGAAAEEAPSRADALAAIRKAVAFFHGKVAVGGGYVWQYSADLSRREGEGKVGLTTVWVQPPGTPFVGEAFVEAYEQTGEKCCLDAARAAAEVLLRGQMHSGGWGDRVELDPAARRRHAYRVDGKPGRKARNYSSLDDDKTQSALRFLMRYDRATKLARRDVHQAARAALDCLLAAQFPNGGWPQVYKGPADADAWPAKPAGYPQGGPSERVKAYWDLPTLNDNLMSDVIDTLLLAAEVYRDDRCPQAAMRAADFLLLAQMPAPQPAWAQQYGRDMCPAWARKFEPPAICGGESQTVMGTLLDIYERTGRRKYADAVARALAYLKRSRLADGRLARFYEMKTNRPLYFTRDYRLTYDDADVPTHYSFKVSSRLESIEKRLAALTARPWRPPAPGAAPSRPSASAVRGIIDALDARGAWVQPGRMRYWPKTDSTTHVISPGTFARNLRLLARYAARADLRQTGG